MVRFDDDVPLVRKEMVTFKFVGEFLIWRFLLICTMVKVRIAVDGTHYMKGMVTYSEDMPKGIDVIYNSTKNSSVGKLGAMKKDE